MLKYIANTVSQVIEDAGYQAPRALTQIVGKGTVKVGSEAALAGIAGLTSGVGPLIMVAGPLSAAVSMAIVHGDHVHRRFRLLKRYGKEIAAKLGDGRTPETLTEKDLELVANGDKKAGIVANPILKSALEDSSKERGWGMAIAAITSLVSVAAAVMLFHSGGALEDLKGISKLLVGGAVGFSIYVPVSTTLHYIGQKFFGLEKETVEERIHGIRRSVEYGKAISQEQVLEVVVAANPAMDKIIQYNFGKRFAKLDEAERAQLIEAVQSQIDLARITADINAGVLRPEELAFTAVGQESGVGRLKAPEERKRFKSWAQEAWQSCVESCQALLPSTRPVAVEQSPEAVTIRAESEDKNTQALLHAEHHEAPGKKHSFVKMVGARRGQEGDMSFVQQVESSRFSEVVR